METTEVEPEEPITLRVDVIDIGLLHLLETRYVVLIEQRENDIVIELYKKITIKKNEKDRTYFRALHSK